MIDIISKGKLPRGYSYVLKSSELDRFLSENDIKLHTTLNYYWYKEQGHVLDAYYWFPNENVPYERLYIRSGTVRQNDAPKARAEMSQTVLPRFIKWIQSIWSLPENSTLLSREPTFDAVYKDGKIEILESY